MKIQQLAPEVREKLQKFEEIRQWYRALYTASGVRNELVVRDCWDAAFKEIPLTPEEKEMYEHHSAHGTL